MSCEYIRYCRASVVPYPQVRPNIVACSIRRCRRLLARDPVLCGPTAACCGPSSRPGRAAAPPRALFPAHLPRNLLKVRTLNQNQNQVYSLEQYMVIPIAIYSFVPPGCRRGRLAAAFPRPRPSGRLAPASAWAVWPRSLSPVCSLSRVCLELESKRRKATETTEGGQQRL